MYIVTILKGVGERRDNMQTQCSDERAVAELLIRLVNETVQAGKKDWELISVTRSPIQNQVQY